MGGTSQQGASDTMRRKHSSCIHAPRAEGHERVNKS